MNSFASRAPWLAVPLIAVGMIGCATTGGNLSSSAERLERSSAAFQADVRQDRESRGYQSDARELAEEARDFRRTLDDRRADDKDVREAFADLSKRYHALRDEVERSRSREAERDLQPVTEAYLDVERAMHGATRRDRVARD